MRRNRKPATPQRLTSTTPRPMIRPPLFFGVSTGSVGAVVSGSVYGWMVSSVVSTVASVVSSVVSTGSPTWNTMCSVRSSSVVVR